MTRKTKKKNNIWYFFQALGDIFIWASVITSSYLINLHYNKSPLNVLWAVLFMSLWIYSKYKLSEEVNK